MRQKKKTTKLSKKKYKIELYGIELHVAKDYNCDKIRKEYIQNDDTELERDDDVFDSKGLYWGILKDRKTGAKVMFINVNMSKHTSKYDLVDTFAHESFHATKCILDWIGMPLTEFSEEGWAYLIGFITGRVYKAILEK